LRNLLRAARLQLSMRRRENRPHKWRLRLAFLVLLISLVTGDYFGYPYGRWLSGRSFNIGRNGLWLRYTWYFGEHSKPEVEAMAQRLDREQISYAFFHVRSIDRDGHLRFRHPESRLLTQTLRKTAPAVHPIAWIYVDGSVPIAQPRVRSAMSEEAKWLVAQCGFSGVQWDYEPCQDGDPSFLLLLDETRAALPRTFISVAAPTWFPWPLTGFGWSEAYFGEVGKRCDQVAVMCYDTGFVLPRSYAGLVSAQAERLPKAVGHCELLLGLPTYERGGSSHNPRAENLKIALKAVREGKPITGIALFADYTTDDAEWAWYDRAWLK
jgi:hypothetical protein